MIESVEIIKMILESKEGKKWFHDYLVKELTCTLHGITDTASWKDTAHTSIILNIGFAGMHIKSAEVTIKTPK